MLSGVFTFRILANLRSARLTAAPVLHLGDAMAEKAKAAGDAAGEPAAVPTSKATTGTTSALAASPVRTASTVRTTTSTTAAATGVVATKKTRRAQPPGDPVQALPIAAHGAAEGATMAKPADTKTVDTATTVDTKTAAGRRTGVKATRPVVETEKIRAALAARLDELRAEYDQTLSEITELQRDRLTDSAGDDQADTGTKTFEREQEISLANGILERITQVERALERLDDGSYGWCERCGNPIPVERLAAFPSATLCVACKQLEERR